MNYSTNSDLIWVPAIEKLYKEIINPMHPIRRINITCNSVTQEECHQYNFFVDAVELERNKKIQKAVIQIKDKFGKNAILKGMNLQESSTMQERNNQIGGHRSGD
jgi:DNA polymerase V